MFVEIFIFLCMLTLLAFWFHRKPQNLPPGEWGLPIVGYAPFMERKVTKTLRELEKKHGKIFSLKLGSITFIILNDYNLIKTACQRPEVSGRPYYYNFTVLKKSSHLGVILSNGQIWSTNRRFALRTLRDFGFGKTPILDEIILTEAENLVNDLRSNLNKPIEVDWSLNVAILNVIFRLVASRHFNVDDKEIKDFSRDINDSIEDMEGPLALFSIFPWMIPLVPKFLKDTLMNESRIVKKREKILDMLRRIIKEHKESLEVTAPRDYIDTYLIELKEQKNNKEYSHWGDEDLLVNIYDFFLAGSETTSSTIRWFFLYMGRHPDAQKKVQKEIDEFIPKGRFPSLHDKDNLPSLEALIYETSRMATLFPNSVPHEVTEETFLEGYTIPKGSIIMPNLESCHLNPQYWKNPNTFSLDHFFDDEGKIIRNKEGFLPFGSGRRQCPGESLARIELFVFMGAILQNFVILEPEGQNVPLHPIDTTNILNYPQKFKVILKNRN